MGLMPRWHVDAWAVRDGMAFVSQRPPDDLRAAVRSVFIAVPELNAIAVGRVSTALWATRANFQDGLHTSDGYEIGFESLDQVKELVRRGYLAGGIGPGPQPGVPPEPPSGPDDVDGDETSRPSEPSGAPFVLWRERSRYLAERQARDEVFELLLDEPNSFGLVAALREFAMATVARWAEDIVRRPLEDEAEAGRFWQWVRLLGAMDLWLTPREFIEALGDNASSVVFERFPYPFENSTWSRSNDAGANEGIVFRVPCPLRPGWDPRIRRLSDQLLLAVSTDNYFDERRELTDFVPSLLAALSVAVQQGPRFALPFSGGGRRRLRAAFTWLSDQMPQLRLPADAERALTDFAWSELAGRNDG